MTITLPLRSCVILNSYLCCGYITILLQRNILGFGWIAPQKKATLLWFGIHKSVSCGSEELRTINHFMLVPIVEMWILIEVGGSIGALPTVALVVLTATLGLSLLKVAPTLMSARRKMDEGSIPASELVSGVMIAVGGALLLTPGFVTDAIGFALLILKLVNGFSKAGRSLPRPLLSGEFRRVDDRNL